MPFIRRLVGLAAALILTAAAARPGGLELVMVEQPGCLYCARWDTEVGQGYPSSVEGRAAPLRRIRLHEPVPADLEFRRPALFTPTFILVSGGRETGRIEGYPGAHFFWPLLGQLLAELPAAVRAAAP